MLDASAAPKLPQRGRKIAFKMTLRTRQAKVMRRCTLGRPELKNHGETTLGMQAKSIPGSSTSINPVAGA